MLRVPLKVTGLGMISGLGGATAACAAARAGITRPTPLAFAAEDRANFEMVPVQARTAGDLTEGFAEVGLAVRLASLALADLHSTTPLAPAETNEMAVLLNLASPYYFRADDERRRAQPVAAGAPKPAEIGPAHEAYRATQTLYHGVIERSFGAAKLQPPPRERQQVHFGDQAGLAALLTEASNQLADGAARACLVGCVDSLAEQRWLDALDSLGILKTALRPVGLIPGEAGVFLLIEREGPQGRPALGVIRGVHAGREERQRFTEARPRGEVLAELVLRNLAEGCAPDAGLVTDLNGDAGRADELGQMRVRTTPQYSPAETLVPGLSFGDTRAAAAGIGVCTALRAFARGYARVAEYVVASINDDGERSLIRVQKTT